jgi:hypothetical protein
VEYVAIALAAFTSTLLRKNNARTIWWPRTILIDLCVLAQEGERRRRRYMVAPRLRPRRLGRLVAVLAQRFQAAQRRAVAGSGWRWPGWGPLGRANIFLPHRLTACLHTFIKNI